LSGYIPWEGQRLSAGDFDMAGGGFTFRDGKFSPSGPGRRLLLTGRDFQPCDFGVTVNPAGDAGLVMGYGQGRFMEIGISGNRLYGRVVKGNKSTPLFPDQLIKAVSPCRLEVRRAGDTLHLFVNRMIWVAIPGGPFASFFEGRIGFFAEDGAAGQIFYDPVLNMECPDRSVSRILRTRACLGTMDDAALLSDVRREAENGSLCAMNNMCTVYFLGLTGVKDYAEAARWLKMAAEKGDKNAPVKLGEMYAKGLGVPQDYAESARWLKMAADHGDADSQYNLGTYCFMGQGVARDYAGAVKLWRMAADHGDADSQYNLGICCLKGQGVPRDHAKAARWFRKAAEQGNALAQYNLGICYKQGLGVPGDFAEAVKWLRKAAEQGDKKAQYKLGGFYANGQGVPRDYVRAHMWLNLAEVQGLKEAGSARDSVAEKMTPAQIAAAKKLESEWRPECHGVELKPGGFSSLLL
jgi:TPR repeat protein